jgi:glycosyltransferase involved in cell wall biosynthesis
MCVAATGRAADFTGRLRELGIDHSVVPAGRDFSPPLVARLWREIRAFEPDLVHTHLIHADLHGQLAAQLAGTTGVSSVHSAPAFYTREPYRSAARVMGRRIRLTIAISEHVRRFVESVGLRRPEAVRMIHYGIDASGWLAGDAERSATRTRLELDSDDVAIGIASRLIPHKGHAMLLEAHAQASRERPELRLLVAGDGPLRTELERQAAPLGGTVRFLGFVDDVRSFMAACDALAFPSQPVIGEGFGLAALEGMAAGRPIVATSTCSLPELVVAGETGFLVDPESSDELAAALVKLAERPDLRAKMGEAGHHRAREAFSLERMVERTVALYRDAL